MKVAFIATGAANMYCGSCMRDNTLAAALQALGHDVTLLPMYTPMRVDEQNASEEHIFYGGIEAYLLQRFPQPSWWRNALLKVAGSQAILRLMPRFDIGSAVDPKANAELTLSMLRGEKGNQAPLLDEMVDWLANDLKPDLIHITNTLISGLAPTLKQRLNVPIVCGLHGEDIFIEGLPAEYIPHASQLIQHNAKSIDSFIAISQYYIDYFAPQIALNPEQITLVRPGITLADYQNQPKPPTNPAIPTIGYLARISPEKGLHILVEAFILLAQSGEFPGLRLRAAGYLSNAYASYVAGIRKRLQETGLSERVDIVGTVDRQQKLDFLASLDIFSVPTIYRDPKGLPVLEALASGVPVVQPNHGAFPELVQATGGGLLHEPENPTDLADKLATLLRDAPRRHALAEQGQKSVYQNFSAERMAQETMDVYRKVLS
jgi:glycosyltransferase involved in cell wall biosynthesis